MKSNILFIIKFSILETYTSLELLRHLFRLYLSNLLKTRINEFIQRKKLRHERCDKYIYKVSKKY